MPDQVDGQNEGRLETSIREIMAREPALTTPETRVVEAAALMSRRNIGAVIVCRDGQIVGILTERDLLRAVGRGLAFDRITVAELMTASPLTISADATWAAAADIMVARGVRHLPVVEQGRPAGMLSVRDLMEHRRRHLEWLVGERTAELEKKNAALEDRDRLMQLHLDMAGRIQRRLLPAGPPALPALGFDLVYHPLEVVSGDYYDFAMLSSGQLGILLADASGHGVPAAFVSVMAKTAFHAYAQGIESPARVLRIMNERLANLMEEEHFITMFYGVVDRHTLILRYALAGHPRPLRYRGADAGVSALEAEGPMIGVVAKADFEERSIQLGRGDLVLIYTDGVTECRNEQDQEFGQHRLEAFLAAHGTDGAPVPGLDRELARFRGKQPFQDDVTCIGLSVLR